MQFFSILLLQGNVPFLGQYGWFTSQWPNQYFSVNTQFGLGRQVVRWNLGFGQQAKIILNFLLLRQNNLSTGAVVVAQLAERSPVILEICGSNQAICKVFKWTYLLWTVEKKTTTTKEPGNSPFCKKTFKGMNPTTPLSLFSRFNPQTEPVSYNITELSLGHSIGS